MTPIRRRLSVPLLTAAVALGGCETTPTGLENSEQASADQGVVTGRIDDGGSSSTSSRSTLLASSFRQAEGIVVAAARVKADGALEALASASAAADGSYRIEKVPAGIDRLVVVATSGSAEVGRVIVHQAVSKNGSVTAAPINGETTVEARVFGELVRSGVAQGVINTVELAQSIEASGKTTADALVQSATDLRVLAEAFKARQDAYTQVLAARGVRLDAKARFEAALPAAVAYAQERHAGAEEKAAEAKASAAVADAYKGKGVDARTQAEASGAAETALLRAAGLANANARLDIAKAAHTVNLLARERQTGEILATLGVPATQREEAKAAFAAARAAIQGATTEEAMVQASAQAAAHVQSVFQAHAIQNSSVPQAVQDRAKSALQNLPSSVELSAKLANARSGGEVASAYLAFVDELRSAVQNAVSHVVAAGGAMDGKAVADLFTGLRASVQTK